MSKVDLGELVNVKMDGKQKEGTGVSKGNLEGLVSEKVGENQEDGSGADLGRQVCAKMGEQQKRGSCVRSRPK